MSRPAYGREISPAEWPAPGSAWFDPGVWAEGDTVASIRVLVAEDAPVVRQALAALLSAVPGVELVGAAEDTVEAIELARRELPDVAIVDARMPGGGGARAVRESRRLHHQGDAGQGDPVCDRPLPSRGPHLEFGSKRGGRLSGATIGARIRRGGPRAMEVMDTFLAAVGHTPLVRLGKVTRGVRPTILAKLEMLNPGGSVKDRIGLRMIEVAEQAGRLKPGGTIIEPTSGNTGHGLAIAAAIKGYKCIFVMPDKMSQEKVALLRAYGAEVVITPTAVAPESPESYYRVADRLTEEIPGAFQPNQYFNQENPKAHLETTC